MKLATKLSLAYVIGISLGDGNLSRPNKRATRLRITCDSTYLNIEKEICEALEKLFPNNKIGKVSGPRNSYFNISIYSNKLDEYMPWKVGHGSKFQQNARVPKWIFDDNRFMRACLRGLVQTDGSIYSDRGYKMINFTNNTLDLAMDVKDIMERLGYKPRLYSAQQKSGHLKYTIRLARQAEKLATEIDLKKEKGKTPLLLHGLY